MQAKTKARLAWSLWLAILGCCAGGLLAALLWIRPLTLGLLASGAGTALVFPLGYATIGLVLTLRRPELLAVVDQTVAPSRASLWLRPSASSRLPP